MLLETGSVTLSQSNEQITLAAASLSRCTLVQPSPVFPMLFKKRLLILHQTQADTNESSRAHLGAVGIISYASLEMNLKILSSPALTLAILPAMVRLFCSAIFNSFRLIFQAREPRSVLAKIELGFSYPQTQHKLSYPLMLACL